MPLLLVVQCSASLGINYWIDRQLIRHIGCPFLVHTVSEKVHRVAIHALRGCCWSESRVHLVATGLQRGRIVLGEDAVCVHAAGRGNSLPGYSELRELTLLLTIPDSRLRQWWNHG